MRYRLLIIDDEAGTEKGAARTDDYDALKDQFDLVYLPRLGALEEMLASQDVHAIVIDFVLENWGTDAGTVLELLRGRYPVALISAHWGPSFEKLRVVMDRHRDVIGQLFTWEDMQDAARRDLVAVWLHALIRRRRNLAVLQLGPNDPIRILQLSDLQFGSTPPPAFYTETELIAQSVRRYWGGAPDFVALTGDLAEHGLPAEYAAASAWLKSLSTSLATDGLCGRYLVVPGNHDVCWSLGWSGRIDLESKTLRADTTPSLPELENFALAPFRRFASELDSENGWQDDPQWWVNGRFRNAGVIFFGINTSEIRDVWSAPMRTLSDRTAAAAFSAVRDQQKDASDAIIVGLMHHPLVANDPKEVIHNPDIIWKNASTAVATLVLLTGHVHAARCRLVYDEGISVLELTGATPTKPEKDRPADSSRGFNLVTLNRQDGRVVELRYAACKMEQNRLAFQETRRYLRDAKGRLAEE